MASCNATERNWSALTDNTKTLPFKCTYPECIRRFATLKEMKSHKLNDPDHYYCKKCNVDCEDWDALTQAGQTLFPSKSTPERSLTFQQHKVMAMSPWIDGPMRGNREVLPKHIVCEFCGMEYKTFGARRTHREQFHPAEQNITCPCEECKTIFTKAAEFIRHLEDGRCEGASAAEFQAYLEQNHVNKQIMKDTTISDRLQENKAAADIRNGVSTEDTDAEYGGVALGGTPSIIDADNDSWEILHKPLEPEHDLISLHEHGSPVSTSRPAWSPLSTANLGSIRGMSIGSRVPSVAGTELSASDYATRISKLKLNFTTEGSRSVYSESYPSLASPSYAASTRSEAASAVTTTVGGSRAPSVWTTGATSRALFSDGRSTPVSEYDEDAAVLTSKDLRHVRWWDPDHEEFEPDFFRSKDLMETRSFGCPFADCEDTYGHDTIDVLKAHIRHAHLTIDHRCPCCHKKFGKPSAVMAHAESNGKCKVQASTGFKQLIADISGGFLKAKRKPVPKIFRQDKARVLADGSPVNGIMQTEFTAKLPHNKK